MKSVPCIGTNRNFPGDLDEHQNPTSLKSLSESKDIASGDYLDANGSEILPENIALIAVVERLHPIRIISLHSTSKDRAGFFRDPMNTGNPTTNAEKDNNNHDLCMNAMKDVEKDLSDDSHTKGNHQEGVAADQQSIWSGVKGYGISAGQYMSAPTSARLAMSTFTIEIPASAKDAKGVKAYSDAIRKEFFN
jgi:hypothetical protein